MPNFGANPEAVNILLVDDRPSNLLALEVILDSPDYRIVSATSGEEGLEYVKKESFAVILLDVMMPGMDGFEFAKRAKAMTRGETPIIFVTAIASDEIFVAKGYAEGAADYLTKPLDPDEVTAKVAVFAELFRKNRQLRLAEQRLLKLNEELEKRADEKARELAVSNERFRLFVDGVKDYGFIQMDKMGRVITWNAGAERLLGYSEAEIIGLPFAKIFTPEDREAGIPERELTTATREGRADDTRWHMRKDGSFFWAQGVTTALFDEKGDLSSFAKVLRDFTEYKRAEEALKKSERDALEARKSAEAANRSKSIFLANISHEIRNPLSAIMGFSELMLQPDLPEEERLDYIDTIIRNGNALSTLIDDVLDLSKIEAGEIKLERLSVSLNKLVSDVMSSLHVKAKEKNLQLRFEAPAPDVPQIIETDPTRLRQILLNIVGNAIKFTPQGGTVSVRATFEEASSDSPSRLSFFIKDSGKGMSVSEQTAIFKPFSQGDPSTTRRFGGTGLGLVLSRKLARALGGDVVLLESEEGRGSTFKVAIDPGKFHRSHDKLVSYHDQRAHAGDSDRGIRGKILLAEDTYDNQVLLKKILEKNGLAVEIVGNGAEAVDKAENGAFDVVLMDVQMPILDGNDAIETLRSRGYKGPIIALTAHAMTEEREKSLKAGANDHLTKPINQKKLLYVLSQYMENQ